MLIKLNSHWLSPLKQSSLYGRMTKFLGRWESGRTWKSAGEKSSKKIVSRGVGLKSWDEKLKERQLVKLEKVKRLEHDKAMTSLRQEQRRQRELNKKKREENAKKAEVTQNISNTKKLRKMSKEERKKIYMK